MPVRDLIGKRGEAIVVARLMDFCGNPSPYFDPHPLGEKCPTYDYLVELVGAQLSPPFFLAQVKSTKQPLTQRKARLKVPLKKSDVVRMVHCPVPTYLIGVDEKHEVAYIVSIHGKLTGPISSIPTAHPLDPGNLRRLWDEVIKY